MKRPSTLALLLVAVLLAALVLWWRGASANRRAAGTERNASLLQGAALAGASTPTPIGLPENRQGSGEDSPGIDPRVAKLFQNIRGGPRRGRLSRQAIEAYLEDRSRAGVSLLVAWQESGDDSYLREAANRFADDPNVQIAAALSPAFAAEHGLWRDRLKQTDPGNPLPYWLGAAEQFAAKQNGLAIAELLAADGKTDFNSYTATLTAERQALFEAAGFDPLRAQIEARFDQRYDYLQRLQSANRAIEGEVKAMRERGDIQAAQDLSVTSLNLGRILTGNERGSLLEQMVGMSVESAALKQIPDAEAVTLLGATSAQRTAELERKRKEFNDLFRNADITDGRSSLEEIVEFLRRINTEGERAAARWLAAQRTSR